MEIRFAWLVKQLFKDYNDNGGPVPPILYPHNPPSFIASFPDVAPFYEKDIHSFLICSSQIFIYLVKMMHAKIKSTLNQLALVIIGGSMIWTVAFFPKCSTRYCNHEYRYNFLCKLCAAWRQSIWNPYSLYSVSNPKYDRCALFAYFIKFASISILLIWRDICARSIIMNTSLGNSNLEWNSQFRNI